MTESEDDAQRRAFTDSGPTDWAAAGDDFHVFVHDPDDPAAPIRTPEEWNADSWDEDRQGAKSLDDARAALADRIADPHAPDTAAVAGAYDELED
jgi:hypothetical protein